MLKLLHFRSFAGSVLSSCGDDFLVLSSPGIANVIVFRTMASKMLRLVNDDKDDLDTVMSKASKQISQEVKQIPKDSTHYKTNISKHDLQASASESLLGLLGKISPKLDNTLPALLIGSIVTSVVNNYSTSLQISLALKMGESKQLVNSMSGYGVTCTYSELRRLKKSAALTAVQDKTTTGISNAEDGLVQVIVDNFDADISSQNGKVSTHSLAVLVTQPDRGGSVDDKCEIRRISKAEMSEDIPYDVDIQRHNGGQQPPMPREAGLKTVLPLKLLAQQILAKTRASETDFAFLQDVVTEKKCPKFHGYNTRLCREQGHQPQPKTKAVYMPLIDMKPSDPDTIMTAMYLGQKLTTATGQRFTVLTCDQQLYRVAVQVLWSYPEKFPAMHLRPVSYTHLTLPTNREV